MIVATYATKCWSRKTHTWLHKEVTVRGCDDCQDMRGPWWGYPGDVRLCDTCRRKRGLK